MKTIGIILFVTIAGIGLATATGKRKESTAISPTDLKWAVVPNTGGVETAPLAGDMMKGPHRVMVKFPAGTVHPLHTHSAGMTILIVSGTFTYGLEGEAQKSYGAGSYLVIPGGFRHASGCAAGAPCVLFQDANGKFDMKLADGARK